MNILTVIPARGGSKSILRKNIVDLNGKPLISYTIESALASGVSKDVLVSTDDHEIADISRSLGAKVPFIRPNNLANDKAESAPVIKHALLFMEDMLKVQYDAVLMLQPTSPLRKADHIKRAVNLMERENFDSVVSIVDVNGYHPLRMKTLKGNKLSNYIEQGFWNLKPRQDLPKVFIRNGAIYLVNREIFLSKGEMIGNNPGGLMMSDKESVNIDSPLDLSLAKLLITENESIMS